LARMEDQATTTTFATDVPGVLLLVSIAPMSRDRCKSFLKSSGSTRGRVGWTMMEGWAADGPAFWGRRWS
jgi:hypothetical protein